MAQTQEVDVAGAEAAIGHVFRDKGLLVAAFTHRSYAHGRAGVDDNQRLEFLGDAVVGLIAASRLFMAAPGRDEGFLTVARSRVVSGATLAEVAAEAGLGRFMRFSPGVRDKEEREGARTLAALCEAVFGAVWLDGGLPAAEALFDRLLAGRLAKSLEEAAVGDPRGELQAWAHRNGFGEPVYETLREEGDGRVFVYEVRVGVGDRFATARAGSRRKACAAAAAALLGTLGYQGA